MKRMDADTWDSDERLEARAFRAAEEGATHGLQSLYTRTPADEVAAMEEGEPEPEEDRTGGVSALFGELLAWHHGPAELGLLAYAMLHALRPWWWPEGITRAERRQIERTRTPIITVGAEVAARMLDYHAAKVGRFDPVKLGKRLHVFCFLFVRDSGGRRVLQSFEAIGRLWQLSATNKRSAPQAACVRMREEFAAMYVRTGGRAEDVAIPGGKSKEARAKCRAAQLGNQNRRGGRAAGDGRWKMED